MCAETIIGIGCLVASAVCYAVYRYTSDHVYIKSKYQRGRYIEAPRNKKGAKK